MIHKLNRELEEARAALAEENDLIQAENEVKEEQARLQEKTGSTTAWLIQYGLSWRRSGSCWTA